MSVCYDRTKFYEDGSASRQLLQPCSSCGALVEDMIEPGTEDFSKPLSELVWLCASCYHSLQFNKMKTALEIIIDRYDNGGPLVEAIDFAKKILKL